MTIETYKGSDNGKYTKVFFVVEDEIVRSVKVGNQVVPVEQGFQFYVEDYVALQIDKCELYMENFKPRLKLKEGKEFELPQKTEKELEIERLKKELEHLENAE